MASFLSRSVLPCSLLVALAACGGTPDEHTHSEVCQRISDACHEVDPGSGPIHDCHEAAHDGTDESCGAIEAMCLSTCMAASVDGGTSDAGASDAGASDGGAAHEHDAGDGGGGHSHDHDGGGGHEH